MPPNLEWWFVDSLEAGHQKHLKQLALYAPEQEDDALIVHYADAFERDGGAWGFAGEGMYLVLTDGETAYAVDGPADPHAPVVGARAQRPLDAFEQSAWNALRDGATIYEDWQGATLRAMGAIHVERSCRVCHAEPEGALIGAYGYRFREIADD